jgi:Na+-translocating ferredoxin:NAD+ oxidoreductase RnfG subunit
VEQFLISLAVALLLLAFAAAAIGAFLVGLIVGEVHKLTAEHQEQKERLERLEELQPKRLTHNLAAGLEDEIAILGDVARHMEAYLTRINSALDGARVLRGNPDGYEQDKPAGRRPKVME